MNQDERALAQSSGLGHLGMRRPCVAPKTRDDVNEGSTAVTRALLRDVPGRPEAAMLHHVLRDRAFVVPGPGEREVPGEVRDMPSSRGAQRSVCLGRGIAAVRGWQNSVRIVRTVGFE